MRKLTLAQKIVTALAVTTDRVEIKLSRVWDKSIQELNFIEDWGDHTPKNSTFTNEPKGQFKALYTRVCWKTTYPKGGVITLQREAKRWKKTSTTEKEFVEEVKKDHGSYYYDMVLTDKDEWCFAPTFAEKVLGIKKNDTTWNFQDETIVCWGDSYPTKKSLKLYKEYSGIDCVTLLLGAKALLKEGNCVYRYEWEDEEIVNLVDL